MNHIPVGIGDIAFFIPPLRIDLETLVTERVKTQPDIARRLQKAVETTGQKAIRFPQEWEDTATFAAEAAKRIILQSPSSDPQSLRYLAVGTESTLDHAKPVSSYVLGMLKKASIPIPDNISTFQTQHACAAGTLALLSVCAQIAATGRPEERGIVINSDTSRYKTFSTAEITQGAGAAAVIAEAYPRLIELDLRSVGYYSQDVDDFFRPLGQETAEVKGYYSIKCYHDALMNAFLDHCTLTGKPPAQVLEETDLFALHSPFRNMPEAGMLNLFSRYLKYNESRSKEELAKKGFYYGIDPISDIGNIYTGSLFLTLGFLLQRRYQEEGKNIVGKKVLLFSYGSGNTMVTLDGRICETAPQVIEKWNIDDVLNFCQKSGYTEYSDWIERSKNGREPHIQESDRVPQDTFFLHAVRKDGYREYAYKNSRS